MFPRPYEIITDNSPPCKECVALAMCINKNWGKIVIGCKLFSKHLVKTSNIMEYPNGVEIQYFCVPLNKNWQITKTVEGKIMFGKGDRRYGKRTL
jgi:hypothetical protein